MTCSEWDGIWDTLGCKWTYPILCNLEGDGMHFNELKRRLETAPPSTVSLRLKELQEEKLVDRTVERTSPKLVLYELTDRGDDLLALLRELESN